MLDRPQAAFPTQYIYIYKTPSLSLSCVRAHAHTTKTFQEHYSHTLYTDALIKKYYHQQYTYLAEGAMVRILVRGLCGCTMVPGAIITTFSYGLRTIFGGRGLVAVKWATASPLFRCPADDGEEAPGTAT
jgi:hypothetical protein